MIQFRGKKGSLNSDLQCGDLIFVFDEEYLLRDPFTKKPLVNDKGQYMYGSNLKGLLWFQISLKAIYYTYYMWHMIYHKILYVSF